MREGTPRAKHCICCQSRLEVNLDICIISIIVIKIRYFKGQISPKRVKMPSKTGAIKQEMTTASISYLRMKNIAPSVNNQITK